MTDNKRVDIEIVDKIASTIETKIANIAVVAKDAHGALVNLQSILASLNANNATNMINSLALADVKLATAQQKLLTEIERTNLIHIRSEQLINKETEALNKLANAAKSVGNLSSASASNSNSDSLLKPVGLQFDKQNIDNLQTQLNKLLGVTDLVGKSAMRSAQVFEEFRLEPVTKSVNDANTAYRALNDSLQKSATLAISKGGQGLFAKPIDVKETTDAVLNLNNATTNLGSSSDKSASSQFRLNYYLAEFAKNAYLGGGNVRYMGGELIQIARLMGDGGEGISGLLKNAGSLLVGFATGWVGLAVAIGGATYSAIAYTNSQIALSNALNGLGAYSGITKNQLNDLSNAISSTAKISVLSTNSISAALIESGNANVENVSKSILLIKNLGATLNKTLDESTKILADLFKNPEQGIKKLNSELHALDAASLKQVENLIAQGKYQEAINIALDKTKPKLIDADNASNSWALTWDKIKINSSNAFNSIGEGLNKVTGNIDADKLINLQNKLKLALEALSNSQNKPNTPNNILENYANKVNIAKEALDKFLENEARLIDNAKDSAFNKLSIEAQDIARSFNQYSNEIEKASNNTLLLRDAIIATQQQLDNTSSSDEKRIGQLKEQIIQLTKAAVINRTVVQSLELYGDTTQRLNATNAIELALIVATSTQQRANLSIQRERINLAGQNISAIEAEAKARQVGAIIITQVAKARSDELLAMRSENALIGLIGPIRQIEQEVLQKTLSARASGNELSQKEIDLNRQLIETKVLGNITDQFKNTIYDESLGRLRAMKFELDAINSMYELGVFNSENYAIRLNKLGLEAADLRIKFGNGDYLDATNVALGKVISNYQGLLPELTNNFGNFFNSITDGFANSIGQAVMHTKDLKTAIHDVATSALSALISALVKLGIQYSLNAALSNTISTASTVASAAQAAATAAAWAPAAAAVSLATEGANSIPADAGILNTYALTQTLSLPKFATGGEVLGAGTGTSDSILARLSNGEFVVNAKAANENKPLLNAINRGSKLTNGSSSNSNTNIKINVNVINNSNASISVEQLSPTEIRIIAQDEAKKVVGDLTPKIVSNSLSNPNSTISKSLNANTNAGRRR